MTIYFEIIHLCPIFPHAVKYLPKNTRYTALHHLFLELEYLICLTLLRNVKNFIRIALNQIVLHWIIKNLKSLDRIEGLDVYWIILVDRYRGPSKPSYDAD